MYISTPLPEKLKQLCLCAFRFRLPLSAFRFLLTTNYRDAKRELTRSLFNLFRFCINLRFGCRSRIAQIPDSVVRFSNVFGLCLND